MKLNKSDKSSSTYNLTYENQSPYNNSNQKVYQHSADLLGLMTPKEIVVQMLCIFQKINNIPLDMEG